MVITEGNSNSAMHLAFSLLTQLIAAYAAKRSITAKRRMSGYRERPQQASLRGCSPFTAAWLGNSNSAMHLAFSLLTQLIAAYAAKRSITAKRRMSGYRERPQQASLRGCSLYPAAWLNSYGNEKSSQFRTAAFFFGEGIFCSYGV